MLYSLATYGDLGLSGYFPCGAVEMVGGGSDCPAPPGSQLLC